MSSPAGRGGRPGAEPSGSNARRFTFRGNLEGSRHGWLRLTPAYSVHLVRELLDKLARPELPILDPFSGTGTTLLASAERGLDCDAVDVNPLLIWLARAKVAAYPPRTLDAAERAVASMARAARARRAPAPFTPPIHHIERWWDAPTLGALARAHAARPQRPSGARDLALLAFCRALITAAQVSFGHQSMSFASHAARDGASAPEDVAQALLDAVRELRASAAPLPRSKRRVVLADSRALESALGGRRYGAVITSPPYCNRMSYIRELRPYMYWLGYLEARSDAGELDWRAIGGTWGAATSRLATWKPPEGPALDALAGLTRRIAAESPLLAAYVARYFADLAAHVGSVARLVAPGGTLAYVIGNSKFYDVVVPAEELLAQLFEREGLADARVEVLRKRSSKRELYEYLVTARRP